MRRSRISRNTPITTLLSTLASRDRDLYTLVVHLERISTSLKALVAQEPGDPSGTPLAPTSRHFDRYGALIAHFKPGKEFTTRDINHLIAYNKLPRAVNDNPNSFYIAPLKRDGRLKIVRKKHNGPGGCVFTLVAPKK